MGLAFTLSILILVYYFLIENYFKGVIKLSLDNDKLQLQWVKKANWHRPIVENTTWQLINIAYYWGGSKAPDKLVFVPKKGKPIRLILSFSETYSYLSMVQSLRQYLAIEYSENPERLQQLRQNSSYAKKLNEQIQYINYIKYIMVCIVLISLIVLLCNSNSIVFAISFFICLLISGILQFIIGMINSVKLDFIDPTV